MKIQEKDIYHGAAITQIVEHDSFTALNKADEKYGHYIINHDIRIFVKYATGKEGPWSFTFQVDDLKAIKKDFKSDGRTFICLVCGKTTVCLLNKAQIKEAIDLSSEGTQWIRASSPEGKSIRVTGQQGEVTKKIPHNAFPDDLFED